VSVTRGKLLEARAGDAKAGGHAGDSGFGQGAAELLGPDAESAHGCRAIQPFHVDRVLTWRPVGNDEMVLAVGLREALAAPRAAPALFRRAAREQRTPC